MKLYINGLIQQAVTQLSPTEAAEVLGASNFDVTYPKPEFGDYASNAAMVLFKGFNSAPASNPAAFAQLLADSIAKLDERKSFSKVEAVGGFINFTLSDEQLFFEMSKILDNGPKYGRSNIGEGKKIIVEYFQNNIAKPPHVGHLRSAVIGDSLVRILRSLGYQTITDTHIGDWGVQFGILLYAYKQFLAEGGDQAVIEADPVNELNKLYVEFSAKIKTQPELRDLGKAEFQKLEAGDEENRELWKWFVEVSLADFDRYSKLLELEPFDHNLGESFYEEKMQAVIDEFQSKALVTIGETNEKYVDLEEFGLGRCILVKSDGSTTYHLRDFATYIFRKKEFDFFRNLYVVDVRQSHHFRQLFKVLELAGYPAQIDSKHIDFGFMSLPEGAISTRGGNVVYLEKLISEAQKRALSIIEEKNPSLDNKSEVAQKVALAAIKYFDLSHNRQSEITFTWESALSFEGNTGPYLQYTHARIHGILRKAEVSANIPYPTDIALHETEKRVMRKLHQFPEIIELSFLAFTPSTISSYLFELAQTLNSFYEAMPVLKESDVDLRNYRLNLIRSTAQVLRNGLNLLGIEAPEEM